MYIIQKRANEGIEVDVSLLIQRQEVYWKETCSIFTNLYAGNVIDSLVLTKQTIVAKLYSSYPKVISLLTLQSGELKLSKRALTFAGFYLGIPSTDKTYSMLVEAYHKLSLFSACQFIYNAVGRKSGVGIFKPRLFYTPTLEYKKFNDEPEVLAEALFGYVESESIFPLISGDLEKNLGLSKSQRLITGGRISVEVEESFIDIILDLVYNDILSEGISKGLYNASRKFLSDNKKEDSSFFFTFSDSVYTRVFDRCLSERSSVLDNYILVSKSAFLYKGCCTEEQNSDSFSVATSFYCVSYENDNSLGVLNMELGFVGEYVDSYYLLKNNLYSQYNPVRLWFVDKGRKGLSLYAKDMYEISWVLRKDNNKKYEKDSGYYDYAFSVSEFLDSEGCSNIDELKDRVNSMLLGDDSYKEKVVYNFVKLLSCILDSSALSSGIGQANLNCTSRDNLHLQDYELELLSDCEELLEYYLK